MSLFLRRCQILKGKYDKEIQHASIQTTFGKRQFLFLKKPHIICAWGQISA